MLKLTFQIYFFARCFQIETSKINCPQQKIPCNYIIPLVKLSSQIYKCCVAINALV